MVALETSLNDFYWLTLQQKLYEKDLQKVFRLLRAENIEPILIKGWAAARYYPADIKRVLGDIDLCVAPERFERAKVILASDEGKGFNVDLHCGLRHHDTVEWENLFVNSRLVDLEATPIRVLRPEDHLRVLCVHWLTDGGEYRQKLLDVVYLIENRPPDFDWERCLSVVSAKRRKWIVCTLGLAQKYLNLDLSDTPYPNAAEQIPEWIIRTVEKEWRSETRLQPLQLFFNNRIELFKQLRKRFPPNPITATVNMEGDFDNKPRFIYQLGDSLKRLPLSLKNTLTTLRLLRRK